VKAVAYPHPVAPGQALSLPRHKGGGIFDEGEGVFRLFTKPSIVIVHLFRGTKQGERWEKS
jgi:hypothetical protein